MSRKPIRVLAAVAAIVVVGFVVAALSRDDRPKPALVDMNHGNVKFAKGEMQRILNAANATTSETPTDELVAAGREIFRDPSRFEKGESCQTCHAEGSASAKLGTIVHDAELNKPGAPPLPSPAPPTDFDGPRDPPALWGVAKTPPYFWKGNAATLQTAITGVVKGHMKQFHTAPCTDANPPASCATAAGDLVAKLVAYVKTLDPPTTAFDEGTMSKAALNGEKLFQGKGGCIECHGGPLFTDNLIHDTGVPQVTFTSPYGTGTRQSNDKGAGAPPVPPECKVPNPPVGCEAAPMSNTAFINTPQLRDLKHTGPYMHNGAFETLTEVVQFYNRDSALAPLNLTDAEVAELVAYLEAL